MVRVESQQLKRDKEALGDTIKAKDKALKISGEKLTTSENKVSKRTKIGVGSVLLNIILVTILILK